MARPFTHYRVFFVNFDYYAQDDFASYIDALAYGKSAGFDCVVHGFDAEGECHVIVGWSCIGGCRWYDRSALAEMVANSN